MSDKERISLAQGEGGLASSQLVESLFLQAFDNEHLYQREDQARLGLADFIRQGDRLAFTTDSYVVDPIEFPGGDIGSLAVNGTINDLAVGGAIPRYLSCALILEEGLERAILERVVVSMAKAAREANVSIVTGDTKVVPRGKADRVFINTAGVGVIPQDIELAARRCEPGDVLIASGYLGDHGAAVLAARGDLALEMDVCSDSRPLHGLIQEMLKASPDIHAIRDATRGGVATVLNEFAQMSQTGIVLQEASLPVRPQVRGFCEILGLEPWYLANEGVLVAAVPASAADEVLSSMRAHPYGRDAQVIGQVVAELPGKVQLQSGFGGRRLLEPLTGEQLPRIC